MRDSFIAYFILYLMHIIICEVWQRRTAQSLAIRGFQAGSNACLLGHYSLLREQGDVSLFYVVVNIYWTS